MKEIAMFEEYLRARMLSPHTVRNYISDVRLFCKIAEGKGIDPLKLDRRSVFTVLGALVMKYTEPATIARKRDSLKQFYAFLKEEGIIARNEFEYLESYKVPRKLPAFLSQSEVVQLLDSIEPNPTLADFQLLSGGNLSKHAEFLATRDRALLETIYGTGTRSQETANLNWQDIDFRAGFIRVNQGKGRRDRIVPITETAMEALWEYGKAYREKFDREPAGENPVFMSKNRMRITTRSIQRVVELRLELAGIKKKLSTHGLRHSFATHLHQRGANIVIIAECLGHASLSNTQKYVQTSLVEEMRDYDKAHPRA